MRYIKLPTEWESDQFDGVLNCLKKEFNMS